jgi:hypothetical protein
VYGGTDEARIFAETHLDYMKRNNPLYIEALYVGRPVPSLDNSVGQSSSIAIENLLCPTSIPPDRGTFPDRRTSLSISELLNPFLPSQECTSN